jgi:hypothetical protein
MTPKRAAVLRPLAYAWLRGPARRDRDQIVIEGRTAEVYEPVTLKENVGIALTRVRTPDDAVTFATKFGLLTRSNPGLPGDPIPETLSQSFADFEQAAADAHRILRTIIDVRSVVGGDRAALERLRKDFGPKDPEADVPFQTEAGTVRVKARDIYTADDFLRDDPRILIRASAWAADGLMNNLRNTFAYVFEPAQLFPSATPTPGQIRIGLIGRTLLDYCHIALAQALATEPIAVCEDCHRPYVVQDKRQRFCEPACANRARFRKFKTKPQPTQRRTQPTTQGRRRSRGKTKTKR